MLKLALGLAMLVGGALAQEVGRQCFDNKDNDHDGKKDCADKDCLAVPANAQRCARLQNKGHKVGKAIVQFKIVKLTKYAGKYSSNMIAECKKINMKPVCDHPSYCRNDKAALYLGQKGHLGYPPHRNSNKYKPTGWDQIQRSSYSASNWDGLCYYTGNANGNNALCNTPLSTHSWKNPSQYNPGFMCGKVVGHSTGGHKHKETHRQCFDHKDNDGDGRSDCQDPDCYKDKRIQQRCRMESNKKISLGAKNGVPAHLYRFKTAKLTSKSGRYSSLMVTECKKLGMKPVCDHPSYCRKDNQALYLGQSGHLSYPPHRNKVSYVPKGFAAIEYNSHNANSWHDICYYASKANGGKALCNIPKNSHSWRTPAQANPGFMCGKALDIAGKTGEQVCEGKNLSEKQCGQLGCCQFVLGFMCKSALTKNKMCTSARGLYFESYAGHGNSLTKLGNPTGATWNKMKPKREHPGLNHDLWYSNDKDFVRDIPKFTDMDNYMMRFRGELQVIKPGEYTFQTNSDDGSQLWLDGLLVVNNDGLHGPRAKQGKVTLTRGWHQLVVTFFEGGGGALLQVSIKLPGTREKMTKLTASMTRPFVWDDRALRFDSIKDGCLNYYDGCNQCVRRKATGTVDCTRRVCTRKGKAECRRWARGWSASGHH